VCSSNAAAPTFRIERRPVRFDSLLVRAREYVEEGVPDTVHVLPLHRRALHVGRDEDGDALLRQEARARLVQQRVAALLEEAAAAEERAGDIEAEARGERVADWRLVERHEDLRPLERHDHLAGLALAHRARVAAHQVAHPLAHVGHGRDDASRAEEAILDAARQPRRAVIEEPEGADGRLRPRTHTVPVTRRQARGQRRRQRRKARDRARHPKGLPEAALDERVPRLAGECLEHNGRHLEADIRICARTARVG
jgi:hypothetical protein